MTLSKAVAAIAFLTIGGAAQAVFVSGNFDPPDVSGTHTFELLGDCVHTGTYELAVNDEGACDVSLTRLTVQLNHSFNLDFSSFLPYIDINSILVVSGQLAGVDTAVIGPAAGSGSFAGNWWVQYYYDAIDPVSLFHNCTDPASGSGCLVDTAFTVTFFPSDANGNAIPEPGSLALAMGALFAGWLARRASTIGAPFVGARRKRASVRPRVDPRRY